MRRRNCMMETFQVSEHFQLSQILSKKHFVSIIHILSAIENFPKTVPKKETRTKWDCIQNE